MPPQNANATLMLHYLTAIRVDCINYRSKFSSKLSVAVLPSSIYPSPQVLTMTCLVLIRRQIL